MNRDIVEGNWKQFKGKVNAWWCKRTDDHIDVISCKHVELGGPSQGASSKEEGMAKEEILSRRAVLRGALAVGCSLLLPASFSINAAPVSPPSTGTDSAASAAPKKVSKASVHYQTHPKGEQKCSRCANFIAESKTCKRVEGPINPEGYCVLWMKKA